MTGNIVTDFFLYFVIASIGGGLTYGAWRLLLDKPARSVQDADHRRGH